MTALLDVLVSASLQGGLFGLAIWVVTSLVPAIPPRVRVWLWWLVSARLLLALVPAPAIEIPWGVAAPETASAGTRLGEVVALAVRTTVDMAVPDGHVTAVAMSAPAPVPVTWRISWQLVGTALLVGVYALGLAWQMARLTRDVRAIGHLLRQATDAPAVVVARARMLAGALGIGLPRVKESGRAQSPLVAGSVRPVVIVPARAEQWAPHDLDLTLAHELAHVKHGDLRWAWVPALAGRVFFFHPIARLAVREYVLAREAACDATAISLLHAKPEAYGRLLLTFGSAPATPLCAAARASTSFTTLKRRLVMLEHVRSSQSRWWWALVGAGALALVPFSLVAQPSAASVLPTPAPLTQADVRLASQPDALPPPPLAPPAPSAPPAPPTPPLTSVAKAPALEIAPADVPPAPPVPPVPPAPPVAPVPPPPQAHADHADVSWVIFDEGRLEPETAAASKADREAARQARQGTEALVWFRRHGQTYVSRDPQVMTAVRSSFSEVEALGEQLSALGAQLGRVAAAQGLAGADDAGIGAALSAHGAEVERLTGVLLELEGLRMQAGTRTPSPEQAQRLADARARLEATKAEMKALAEQQRAKSRQARVQSAELRAESARMREVGGQMRAAVTSAMSGVATAFDAAIADGRAQRHP